jgi:hypothetical protein
MWTSKTKSKLSALSCQLSAGAPCGAPCCNWQAKGRGIEVDFQVNGETYFLSLAEDERRWLVFVESATGSRDVPVYVDEAESDDFKLVVDDKERRKILN